MLPFIIFFIIIAVVGQFINKYTTNISGSGANFNQMGHQGQGQGQQQQQQQQPYYTYQQQAAAQQPRMQKQQGGNVAPPGSEQTQWFQGNQNNAGNEKSYYSSYSDYDGYDHALDDRTKQIDKESHEKGQAQSQYHY